MKKRSTPDRGRLCAALLALLWHPVVAGQTGAPVPPTPAPTVDPLQSRARTIPDLIAERGDYEAGFAPTFRDAISASAFADMSRQLIALYGAPDRLIDSTPTGPHSAVVRVAFTRGVATFDMVVEPTPPNRITGLRVAGFRESNDTLAAVKQAVAALPGVAAFAVGRIGPHGEPVGVDGVNPDAVMAVGSVFKLVILAELAEQVRAGRMAWDRVIPLGHESHSSPATHGWATGTPVTARTLANWMIGQSDNRASDTLLHAVGRGAVERRWRTALTTGADRTLPLLDTVEAFALKSDALAEARAAYLAVPEPAQPAALQRLRPQLTMDRVRADGAVAAPRAIDTVEWFATSRELLTLLTQLARHRDPVVRDVLGLNPGLPRADAADLAYVGYKGGSEAGVIALSYLAQGKDGDWVVVAGAWNDPARAVDDRAFIQLMTRAIRLGFTPR